MFMGIQLDMDAQHTLCNIYWTMMRVNILQTLVNSYVNLHCQLDLS